MRALLVAAWLWWSLVAVRAVVHCAQRREISPCSCRLQEGAPRQLVLACERMSSYARVAAALTGVFAPGTPVTLALKYSEVHDVSQHRFSELGLLITNLQLNNDNIRYSFGTLITPQCHQIALYLHPTNLYAIHNKVNGIRYTDCSISPCNRKDISETRASKSTIICT